MMWTGGFGWGWMILGSLMMILFWGGLIALVVWGVRGFARGGTDQPTQISGSAQTPTALEILKTRYAKGEITQEEFDQIRRDLVSS